MRPERSESEGQQARTWPERTYVSDGVPGRVPNSICRYVFDLRVLPSLDRHTFTTPVGPGIARNVPRRRSLAREGAEHQRSTQIFKMRQMAIFVRLPIFKDLPNWHFPDECLLGAPERSYFLRNNGAESEGQQART